MIVTAPSASRSLRSLTESVLLPRAEVEHERTGDAVERADEGQVVEVPRPVEDRVVEHREVAVRGSAAAAYAPRSAESDT